jgi:hypothetical protein
MGLFDTISQGVTGLFNKKRKTDALKRVKDKEAARLKPFEPVTPVTPKDLGSVGVTKTGMAMTTARHITNRKKVLDEILKQ